MSQFPLNTNLKYETKNIIPTKFVIPKKTEHPIRQKSAPLIQKVKKRMQMIINITIELIIANDTYAYPPDL